jgi:protein phosphatase
MIEAFGLSDPGCVRPNNEDSFLVDNNIGLFLLADGMGGAQGGETASHLAVETVADFIGKSPEKSVDVLREAFEEANRRVLAVAGANPSLAGMGTTLVGLLDCGDKIAVASVGDSRLYRFQDDQLSPITDDQTWANEVGRRIGVEEDRLRTHPMRHVLTMAIGVDSPLRVQTYIVEPENGMQLLLCSDGLHGVISQEAIATGLTSQQSLEAKCHYLIDAARKAGGPDNITTVVLQLQRNP